MHFLIYLPLGLTFVLGITACGSDTASPAGTGGTASGVGGGGAQSSGGNSPGSGGTTPGTGGSSGGSGAGGSNATGGSSSGGVSGGGAGGSSATGGSSTGGVSGGGTGGSGPDVDQNGKTNATPGTSTSTPQDYLRLGEIRLLNNNWGSEDLGCNAPMSVFVNQDRSFGWNFDRGNCDTANSNQKPDFPQVEFGIHPFGIGSDLVTSPEFSSTTLLPLQIRNFTSASVTVDGLNATFSREGSWNITFEFWLSERNPLEPNPGVHTELMTFWGWQSGRWPSAPGADGSADGGSGTGAQVSSESKTYTLWVQNDNWAEGWRYYQFRANDGPQKSFNGKLNIKSFLDYLVNTRGFSPDLWVTRFEVGSEIDDLTTGTVTMRGITFEVNGQTRSAVLGN